MGLTSIDLNADLAEECGDDEALYPYLSSANICCGRHAGGPESMKKAVLAAIRHDVVIGAHVGYEDRENFGRIDVELDYDSLRKSTFDQIHDLLEIASSAGAKVQYVKPHGALYHTVARQPLRRRRLCRRRGYRSARGGASYVAAQSSPTPAPSGPRELASPLLDQSHTWFGRCPS